MLIFTYRLRQMLQSTKPQQYSTKYPVPALEKGLDILETLAATSTPQSLTDLAHNLGRGSSEIFRMLNCLEVRGYIGREEHSGNYFLTLKLYQLAHTHSPVDHLLNAAHLPMEALAQSVRESCHLGILRHGRLVVLKQSLSPRKVRLSVEVGGSFSLIHSVSGRLLLAYLPAAHLAAILKQDEEYQRLTSEMQDSLKIELADICRNGYATAQDENHIGVTDLSVLVGNPDIGLMAALTVACLTGTRSIGDKGKILAELQACAREITEVLGIEPDMN